MLHPMPPFDPRQVEILPSIEHHMISMIAACIFALLAYRFAKVRLILGTLAASIALTTPFLGLSLESVWGAYPTIDKEGSLLFFRDGVHLQLFQFEDPAHRLIGFHLGHLWIAQFFAFFVPDYAAFNIQALLNIVLTWYCCTILLEEVGAKRLWAWLLASQLALHAHLFRDIQFYTIEKSALYGIPLFWFFFLRTQKNAPYSALGLALSFFLSSWINLYWGIFEAFLCCGLLMVHKEQITPTLKKGLIGCGLMGIGIALYQWKLMHAGPSFSPESSFLERAALDRFSLWPLSWNRLPWFSSLPPLLVGLIIWKKNALHKRYIGIGLLFFLLSLGPYIFDGLPNPLYMIIARLPGLWRFAKPEAFFFISFLCLLSVLIHVRFERRTHYILALLFLIQWIVSVRIQPEYPRFSQHIPSTLPQNWEKRIFRH